MKIVVLTLFPAMFAGPFGESILGRAQAQGKLAISVVDLRQFAHDAHRTVDDYPYGGGAGMVLKAGPLVEALEWAAGQFGQRPLTVLPCAQGRPYGHQVAKELAGEPGLVFLCGHYEGVDERVRAWVDLELSLGDFVLTGGEIPAMAMVDSIARLVPGVLGHADSIREESFAHGLLEGPQYTRPADFRGMRVPAVLLGGDHEAVRRWRRKEALRRTGLRRPDMLARTVLTYEDRLLLEEIEREVPPVGG
ncbi:MAG TPA: tRNA (guanosine(37)-N1)-methyltransferase TrmD [Clostridiales bacterium UBA8153]|nr:tRNA (guanosine(37)-N1)-methyltransferase TrmD [Clostridiales bacterium UBA8153]